jgi:hypothetical protein
MANVVDFCMQNDPNPPNFINELINLKILRTSIGEADFEMTEHEQQKVNEYKRKYYK